LMEQCGSQRIQSWVAKEEEEEDNEEDLER
jgi:hypothetical protein